MALSPEEKRERNRVAARKRYHKMKHDPVYMDRYKKDNLDYYYRVIRPNPDAMEKRRKRILGYQKKRRIRFQETRVKLQVLIGGKCVSCGITDPRLLDFDHIDPRTKTMMISQKLHLPFEVLVHEVMKCQLLCPNCHRLKTIEKDEHDSYKHREFRNEFRSTFKPLC